MKPHGLLPWQIDDWPGSAPDDPRDAEQRYAAMRCYCDARMKQTIVNAFVRNFVKRSDWVYDERRREVAAACWTVGASASYAPRGAAVRGGDSGWRDIHHSFTAFTPVSPAFLAAV